MQGRRDVQKSHSISDHYLTSFAQLRSLLLITFDTFVYVVLRLQTGLFHNRNCSVEKINLEVERDWTECRRLGGILGISILRDLAIGVLCVCKTAYQVNIMITTISADRVWALKFELFLNFSISHIDFAIWCDYHISSI